MNPRDSITYCGTTYHARLNQSLECVKRVAGHVDRIILVQNDFQDQDAEILEEQADGTPIEIISKPWIDHFSAYRNRYLSAVRDGWILVSDPDEWFSEDTCRSLREFVQESEFGSRYNIVAFNSVDTFYSDDYKTKVASNRSSWFKQLFFKYYAGMYYSGVAGGIVHEQMIHPPEIRTRAINAPPECSYEHVKTKFEQTERGVRNFWIGGGGINDMGANFPDWKMLHERMLLEHGISSWHQFHDFLKAGKIPGWLADWIKGHQNYQDPPDSKNPLGSEIRELYMLYYDYYHPEEK